MRALNRELLGKVIDTCRLGSRSAAMAFKRKGVELLARHPVLARQHFRTHELAEHLDPEALLDAFGNRPDPDPGLGVQRDVGAHRHPGHALDARRDHHILRAREHRLGGKLDRLLR